MKIASFPQVLLLFILPVGLSFGQEKVAFGKISPAERELKIYPKDSSAHAVILYERGDNYFKVIDRRIRLIKEYHTKIKILHKDGFAQGTVEIPLYDNGTYSEKITQLRAATHNQGNAYNVLSSEIFESDHSERWRVKTFTFPKMEEGSILEYTYTLVTPFDFNFSGWDFQDAIPKIYSEFNAEIPGNWVYNRALTGSLKLDVNEAKIKKGCFSVPGYPQEADCEILKYAMKDIPAFTEESDFMLAGGNYKSRIDFELSEYNKFDGTKKRYTKSWKDVDREFKSDRDIGLQLTKKGFFERHVPEELFMEKDPLTKAQNIYRFLQDHYTWNQKYSTFGKARVKEAFDRKEGNAWEINMSLINLLNAADIPTNLMLVATR
ncbi:MAG: transglutaminase domain-containing protein [Bacteroidota bacterium]